MTNKLDAEGLLLNPGTWPKTAEEVPTRNIAGVKTPYYSVQMTGGTACDLV